MPKSQNLPMTTKEPISDTKAREFLLPSSSWGSHRYRRSSYREEPQVLDYIAYIGSVHGKKKDIYQPAQKLKRLPGMRETRVQSLGRGKIPCRRKWQPTPVLLPGESRGARSLVGYSPWGCKEWDTLSDFAFTFVHFQVIT